MPPLNPNNTARYKIFYDQNGFQHTQQVRVSNTATLADFDAVMGQLWTDMSPNLYGTTITDVQFAAALTDIFVPVASTLIGTSYGTGAIDEDHAPIFADYVGRTAGGRRVRLTWFGWLAGTSAYRFTRAESTVVANTLDHLTANANVLLGIDVLVPFWKQYADVGVNAYWQRNVRV